jgi:hypothetical protein
MLVRLIGVARAASCCSTTPRFIYSIGSALAQGTHRNKTVTCMRFREKLGGRHGTFVLQGQKIVENGKIKASLENGPTERWIIGSNDVGIDSLRSDRRPPRSQYIFLNFAGRSFR